MLFIAIVEDNEKEAGNLKKVLERYQEETGELIDIVYFRDAETFLTNYKPKYDIVFMDIMLGQSGMNGINAAKKLRKYDTNIAIIFTTSMLQFAINGYEVQALDYLVKPVKYYNVKMRIDGILRRKNEEAVSVNVSLDGGFKRISSADIYYIEVISHTLYYHTREGEFSARGKLGDLEKLLAPVGFARNSVSYLVNLNHCTSLKGDEITVGGETLKVTRGKKKEFMYRLAEFLEGGGK